MEFFTQKRLALRGNTTPFSIFHFINCSTASKTCFGCFFNGLPSEISYNPNMPARSDRARYPSNGQNGQMANGEGLPPSTYAAQIVQNFAKATVVKSQRDYAGIGQLLENILEAEQRNLSIADGVETDLEANHNLVYTLSRHLLELFHHSDPFLSKDARNVQVSNCLNVIDLTIRKSPNVLYVSSERKIPQGPLLLWILPQLTNLILLAERESSTLITKSTASLLRYALSTRHRLTGVRGRRFSSVQYVELCVEGRALYCIT